MTTVSTYYLTNIVIYIGTDYNRIKGFLKAIGGSLMLRARTLFTMVLWIGAGFSLGLTQWSYSAEKKTIFTGDSLSVPCASEQESTNFCSVGLRRCGSESEENTVIHSITQQVNQYFDKKIEYYYAGKDVDFDLTTDRNKPQGHRFLKACNLLDGEVKFQKHRSLASLSKRERSCGKYMDIRHKLPNTGEPGGLIGHRNSGSRENAYIGGAWIAALNCYKREVLNEVATGKLKISTASQAFATEVGDLYRRGKKLSVDALQTEWASNLCGQKNISQIDQCQSKQGEFQLSQSKQHFSPCYLQAARQATEAAFTDLVVNEVYSRADIAYDKLFVRKRSLKDGNKETLYYSAMMRDIIIPATKEGEKKCDDECDSLSASKSSCMKCVTNHVNVRYRQKLPGWFKKKILKRRFPANAAQACMQI